MSRQWNRDSKLGVYILMTLLTGAGIYVGRSMASAGSVPEAQSGGTALYITDRTRSLRRPGSRTLPASAGDTLSQQLLRPSFQIAGTQDVAPTSGATQAAQASGGARAEGSRAIAGSSETAGTAPAAPANSRTAERNELATRRAQTAREESAPAPRIHVVLVGERLWDIARIHYGKGIAWKKIKDANPQVDPMNLQPGAKLLIP